MGMRVWDITFTVSDLQRAVEFYGNVLGLEKKYQYSSYAGFDCGGVEIGLRPGNPSGENLDMPCVDFLIPDIDRCYEEMRRHGVRLLKEPHDTPWGGRTALFTDPDGNVLQLVQIDWRRYLKACASQ